MFKAIQIPTVCPSCGGELEFVNDLLYCRNSICGDRAYKKIEHFAKTLKIKGLGPASIKKLDIQNFDEIYNIPVSELVYKLSSEKLAEKLSEEIDNSRSAPLDLVLPAFGVSLIGKTATEKLSHTVKSLFEINTETCEIAGLGPKATQNLCNWLDEVFYPELEGLLPFNFEFKNTTSTPIKGVVCISGKLKTFKNKAEAAAALSLLGYEVKSGLTKQVTLLVNESGIESAKTRKARNSGVTIINNLTTFLENNHGTS